MRMTKVGDVKTFYGCIYFYAIDTIMKCLEDHPFNLGQKRDVEMLLFRAVNSEEYMMTS